MKNKSVIFALLTVLLLFASLHAAVPINSVTVADVSSELAQYRAAIYTIDGSGLSGTGTAGTTHVSYDEYVTWTTNGTLGETDYDPYITYDLGGIYDLSTIRIWNGNSSSLIGNPSVINTLIGPKTVDVYTSIDGVKFTKAETVEFDQGEGSPDYKGQDIVVDYKNIRYIKFDFLTNHDGAVFDGTNNKPGLIDKRSLIQLCEVRFEGERQDAPVVDSPTPENYARKIQLKQTLTWALKKESNPATISKTDLVIGIGNYSNGESIHKKNLKANASSYRLPDDLLEIDGTYWWQINTVSSGKPVQGDIWRFKTRSESRVEREKRLAKSKEFLDAKFGAFICWDMSSLIGKEISWGRKAYGKEKYDQLYKRFEGEDFDATKWAKDIKRTGLKYVVIVPKHHAGFCMWDTETTDYNIMNSPFGRDWLAELIPALRKEGIKIGLYWTIADWYQPSYGGFEASGRQYEKRDITKFTKEFMYPQLKELLTKYGEIFCFWSDGQWDQCWDLEQGKELYAFLAELQPNMLINNRCARMPPVAGLFGPISGSTNDLNDIVGDYLCPELVMGNFYTDYPWESFMSLDKRVACAWVPPFNNISKLEIQNLLLAASGNGGNLLMTIAPDARGRLDPYHMESYMEVGAWLYLHEDSFYGTRTGPYKPGTWGISLHKENKAWLYITDWSTAKDKKTLILPKLPAKIISSQLLSGTVDTDDPSYSLVVKHGDTLEVTVHPQAQRDITIVELVLDKHAGDIDYIDTGKEIKGIKAPGYNTWQ